MNQITIVLIGAQASGKSTLEKWVDEELGIPRLISHTTRPRRPTDRDDEYHFVSEEEFMAIKDADGFIEYRRYVVADGSVWYYGLAKSSLYAPLHVVVLDYDGFSEFRKTNDCIGVHIFIDKEECFYRINKFRPGYPMDEAQRRFKTDVTLIQVPCVEDPLVFHMDSKGTIEKSRKELLKFIDLAREGLCERTLGPSDMIEFGPWGWRRRLEGSMSVLPKTLNQLSDKLKQQKLDRLHRVLHNLD